MSLRKFSELEEIQGNEGARIKQYFHPHNTLNGIKYSFARFELTKGSKTLRHKLNSSEVYFILRGRASMFIDGEKLKLGIDDSVYVPPMSEQFIENIGDESLHFLCIVDPAWKQEDETILE